MTATETGIQKAIRIAVILTVGLPFLVLRGLGIGLKKAWMVVVIHRGLQIVLSVLLVILGIGAWQFGPLLFGRLSLMSAAEWQAQHSEGRNTLDMENALRRKAFRLGFRGAITQKDPISIERTFENGITLCTIKFEFQREVFLFGLWRLQIPVSGTVQEAADPKAEAKELEL